MDVAVGFSVEGEIGVEAGDAGDGIAGVADRGGVSGLSGIGARCCSRWWRGQCRRS